MGLTSAATHSDYVVTMTSVYIVARTVLPIDKPEGDCFVCDEPLADHAKQESSLVLRDRAVALAATTESRLREELYAEAEELAAKLAHGELTQRERAEGGDIIHDLLDVARGYENVLERRGLL